VKFGGKEQLNLGPVRWTFQIFLLGKKRPLVQANRRGNHPQLGGGEKQLDKKGVVASSYCKQNEWGMNTTP